MQVGVIVPAHGESPYLGEALESVLAQRPEPAEVVVVDDGSPVPLALDRAHAARCRLVRSGVRGGPAAARAAAAANLATPLLALCDSDDVWRAERLAAGLDCMARHPGAAVCFGRVAEVIDARGDPTGERWDEPAPGPLDAPAALRALYRRDPVPNSSALVRREALEAAGGFDSRLPAGAEDWDLWLRIAAAGGAFVFEPRVEILYRRHEGALTAEVSSVAQLALAVHAAHRDRVDEAARREATNHDLTVLAQGRVRERRYAEARALLAAAARISSPGPRRRIVRSALALPGLRSALGRRDPYARRRSLSFGSSLPSS